VCDSDGNYSVDVDISMMPSGAATVSSTVEDADGNTESTTVGVDINNPLSVTITGPTEGGELTGDTDTVTGACAPSGSAVNVSIGSDADAESATGSSICSEGGTYVVTIDTSELTSGTKTITSEICIDNDNCETAEVGVILVSKETTNNSGTVTLNAEDDVVNLAAIDGINGKPAIINVLDNDSYDENEASTADVEIQLSSTTVTNVLGDPVDGMFILDATGSLTIESGSPAGTYTATYWICDKTNLENCDSATVTIVIPMPPIVAEDESGISFTNQAGITQLNLLSNDTFNEEPATNDYIQMKMDEVTIKDTDGKVVTDAINVDANGNVSLMEGATPGLYYVEYMICDKLNTTNCDTATLSLVVQQAPERAEIPNDSDSIDATVESASPNNGDSNNDGIADSSQSMVSALLDCPPDSDNCDVNVSKDSKRDWVTLSIVDDNGESLNDKCQEIVNPYTTQEKVTNVPGPNDIVGINAEGTGRWTIGDDPDYVYPLGLVGFAVECTEPNQEVAGVKSYFYGHQRLLDEGVVSGAGDYFIRKYADPTGSGDDDSIDDATYNFMSDLVNVEVTEEISPCDCDSNGDGTMDKVLVLTYTLKDDAKGDNQKGQMPTGKYRIFDPHGPALSDVNFSLSKRANKKQATVGDVVSFTLMLENLSRSPAKILVHDKPSAGLSIKQDTIKVNKDSIIPKVTTLADGTLEITDNGELITVDGKERITISYLAQVSPGAVAGEISNIASVKASSTGQDLSNVAMAKLNVGADPIFDLATIIGKVYNDSNKNEQQDQGEQGLAGVRLATVSGMIIITDKHGRYHIPGVESDIGGRGKNFILKLDDHSISSCAKVISENPRVVRLTSGLMSKIDFRVDLGEAGYTAPKEEMKLLDIIYFANANDDISDDQIRRLDEQLRPYLHMKGVKVRVSGHTDSDKLKSANYLKKYGDNYGLSHYRAQTVGAQLQSRLNIPDSRIEYAAYGPDKPIANNDTEAGQAKNRRVEVQIVTLTEQKVKSSAKCDTKGATQKISRTDGAKTVKQIRAVLSDDFYDIGSVAPRNPAKLDRLLNILNKRGGTVVVKSEIEALAKARRMALESLVTDKVTVTNE
jgi:fimbrial isopeptide formation D2 family protein